MERYTVVLVPDAETSAYHVVVPAIPEVITFGTTIAEAVERAREAIGCHIRGLAQDGEPFPVETPGLVVATVEIERPADVRTAAAD
jgi:predicted RNase H-like HicB family nuclease